MRTARLCSLIRGCTALLLTTALIAACGSSSSADIVQPTNTSVGTKDCQPGITYYGGFSGFATSDNRPVHVRDVQVLGAPRALKVVGVYAVRLDNTHSRIGLIPLANIVKYRAPERFYPPSKAVLQPVGDHPLWYFVVAVKATAVGEWQTSGLRITDDSGSRDFPDKIGVTAVANPPPPAEDCPTDPPG